MRPSNAKGSATIPLIITIAILVLLSGFYFYSIVHRTAPSNPSTENSTTGASFSSNNPNSSVYLQTPTQENYQPLITYQATDTSTSTLVYRTSIQPTQPVSPASNQTTIVNNTPQTIAYSYSPFITSTVSSAPTTNSYAPQQINPVVWPTQTTNTTTPATTTKKKRGFGGLIGLGNTQIGSAGFNWTSLLVGIGSAGLSALVNNLFSDTLGGGGNFGGRVTETTQCTCGDSTLLYINDVSDNTLQLLYEPLTSTLYSHGNYQTGATVMGTYTSGGECEVYSGEECQSEGSPDGTINIIGTSE